MSFFTPNIIVSNPIPQEVRIYYSKDFAIVSICFLSVFVGMGIFWLTIGQLLLGVMVCLMGLCFIFLKTRGLLNNKPQIIINAFGIETSTTQFYKWAEISEERVSGEYTGRGARPMLEFTYPGGKGRIKVEPLNIRPQDLDVLLKYYKKPWDFRSN
jgi:hypothetical protein